MSLDYSNYKVNNKFYNGADKKIGITVNEENYMIKFQNKKDYKRQYNHICEYLGSHIFSILGIDAQEAFLGYYNGEEVVLVKDFNKKGSFFVPFNELMDLTLDDEERCYEYSFEDVITLIKENKNIADTKKTVETLWEIYIVDALLANSDRHANNWGFIKTEDKHYLAPIFDNDGCLFPEISNDEEIKEILNDENRLKNKIYSRPVSPIKLDGRTSLYYEVISSLKYEECNKALIRIVERINLEKIYTLIDSVDMISKTRKEFYKTLIKERYEKLLLHTYKKLVGDNND